VRVKQLTGPEEQSHSESIKCRHFEAGILFENRPYTYDLCTTLVVQEAGGCLTKKKPPRCKAVLPEGEAVFVDFFHF
jgi:hypothetical protein